MTLLIYLIIVFFILGLFTGSFLNLLADRLVKGEQVIKGRSHCDFCKKPLKPKDLVPIASYFVNKGKSSCCNKKISGFYPFSELLTGIVFALIPYYLGFQNNSTALNFISLFYLTAIMSVFLAIFFADIKYRLIPDKLIVVGIVIVLLFTLFNITYSNVMLYSSLNSDVFGTYLIEAGYFELQLQNDINALFTLLISSFGIFAFFMLLIIITKGRGMGGGDAKLGILIGLFNGFPNNVVAIMLGFTIGALYSIILLITNRTSLKDTIPFGPFLILGSIISMIWGSRIIGWYLSF